MFLLESYTNLEIDKKCANANSATACEEAAGVLITAIPLPLAWSTSMLSKPTPPLAIAFKLGVASIKSCLTFVALRTQIASYSFNLAGKSS